MPVILIGINWIKATLKQSNSAKNLFVNIPTALWFTLLTLFLFLTGCNMSNDISQTEVELFIGAQLPKTATNIKTSEQQGLDRIVYLRFELPANDLNSFLQTIGFKKELKDSFAIVPTVSSGGRPEWWLPDNLINYSAEEDIINGKSYQIAVDKANPITWVVYLLVSTI